MSARDPLKTIGPREVLRDPADDHNAAARAQRRPALEIIRCTYRPSDADFYCWKFGVWYNVLDCCYRHDQRTYEGCVDCGQGRGNLRQNIGRYRERHRRRGATGGP